MKKVLLVLMLIFPLTLLVERLRGAPFCFRWFALNSCMKALPLTLVMQEETI